MSDAAPSFSQIKAQVEAVREAIRKAPGAREPRRFGIQSMAPWIGERRRVDGGAVVGGSRARLGCGHGVLLTRLGG